MTGLGNRRLGQWPSGSHSSPILTKRKVFVSYHHQRDQFYYDQFSLLFAGHYDIITDTSVGRKIDSDDSDYLQRVILVDFLNVLGKRSRQRNTKSTLQLARSLWPSDAHNICDKTDRIENGLFATEAVRQALVAVDSKRGMLLGVIRAEAAYFIPGL